LADPASGQ